MPPFFATLVVETDESRRRFETHPVTLDAVARGLSAERYRKLLLELYHIVWHFNPVSAAATSRMDDAVRDVRYFLYRHMHEESGHEIWVVNDLRALGVAESAVRAYEPSVATLAMCGYNYWAADRKHPCSVLGMLYVLEVIASVYGGSFANALRESLLLDGDAGVTFISSHASLDSAHLAELKEVIDKVTDPQAQHAIIESVHVNFAQITRIIEAI
jgi:pyrroloquinoline quinone (PQQ) biosynthesis protein C